MDEPETAKVEVKKKMGIEKYIILAMYVAVALVVGYFVFASIFPEKAILSTGYSISARDTFTTKAVNSLYIDNDNILGEKVVWEDGITVRPIKSPQIFNLVFTPKTVIPKGTEATLEMNLYGGNTSVYMNNSVIIPNLDNYELLADFNSDSVYIRKDLLTYYNKDSLETGVDVPNAEEFVYRNLPGVSAYSFKEESNTNPVTLNVPDYKNEDTVINGTFRDSLNLAVYTENSLIIEFTKQDLNNYIGKDEYTVEIKDQVGKSLFTQLYEDDGQATDTRKLGQEETYKIQFDDLQTGVYYISFIKDSNNPAADSTLKKIKINSNKMVILGTFLPIISFEFYTKVVTPKTIGFLYWWESKDQIIHITETGEDSINLNSSWFNKRYDKELTTPGDYTFSTDVGYLYIYAEQVSPSKENWFDLPIMSGNKFNDQDVLVIDKNKLVIDGDKITYTGKVILDEKTTKIKMQVLDEDRIYLEDIKIIIN